MTQHILTLSNYLTSPLVELGSILKSWGKALLKAIQEAQQEKAYYYVAEKLHSEYKHESFEYVLEMVKKGKVDAITR